MKQFLYKCSSPGWEKEVGSELEAKEVLYSHICSTCLKDIIYEQVCGERSYGSFVGDVFTPEQQGVWNEIKEANLGEVTLDELLATCCGLEYSYEEVDI